MSGDLLFPFCFRSKVTETMQSFTIRITLLFLSVAPWVWGTGVARAQNTSSPDRSHAESDSASRPAFRLLRQEEDWSALAGETGGSVSLKFLPLPAPQGAVLTIGGEVRSYGRFYRNEQWGRGPVRDAYLLQRLMVHGSIRSDTAPGSPHLRTFVQLKSGLVANREGPLYPPDKDLIGINQAFLEVGGPLGERGQFTVRGGRQELHYGAGRMVAVREGPNVRLGYDAVLARYRVDEWRAELFVAKPNETPAGVFDNGWMPGRTLWGAYVNRQTATGPSWSLYYFGTDRTQSPADPALHSTRHTIGGRGYGRAGRFRYDWEGAVQVGRYRRRATTSTTQRAARDAGAIRAWMVAGRLSYRLSTLRGTPTVGVRGDFSSGDVRRTEVLETFAAPYPSGRSTGAGSRLGPGNLANVRPVLAVQLSPTLRMQLSGRLFWRMQSTDGIYAIWGASLRPPTDRGAHFVGGMPEVLVTWNASRSFRVGLEGSHFFPGTGLSSNLPGRGMTHVGLRARYRF